MGGGAGTQAPGTCPPHSSTQRRERPHPPPRLSLRLPQGRLAGRSHGLHPGEALPAQPAAGAQPASGRPSATGQSVPRGRSEDRCTSGFIFRGRELRRGGGRVKGLSPGQGHSQWSPSRLSGRRTPDAEAQAPGNPGNPCTGSLPTGPTSGCCGHDGQTVGRGVRGGRYLSGGYLRKDHTQRGGRQAGPGRPQGPVRLGAGHQPGPGGSAWTQGEGLWGF